LSISKSYTISNIYLYAINYNTMAETRKWRTSVARWCYPLAQIAMLLYKHIIDLLFVNIWLCFSVCRSMCLYCVPSLFTQWILLAQGLKPRNNRTTETWK
jgi:hypothetical protein